MSSPQITPACIFAALTVFRNNIVIVIGPTPPGYGDNQPATSLASLNATSPARRYPFSDEGSSTRLVPTSITTAPGLIQSAFTISGLPTAETRKSALRQMLAKSLEREWHIVTVASRFTSNKATGIPTMFERPSTTAFAPFSWNPV